VFLCHWHFVSFPKIIEFVSQTCAMFGVRWLCARLFTAVKRNEGFEGSVINRHAVAVDNESCIGANFKPDVQSVITKKRCQVNGKFLIMGEILK
jgi:hypothetical protein